MQSSKHPSLIRVAALSATLVAIVGCGLTGPDTHDDPAFVIFYSDTTDISAPDTVTRGTAFTVSFPTYGGGCTSRIARTDVNVAGNVGLIRPYNRTYEADACTADLRFLYHTAQFRVDTPGSFTIRVVGRQVGRTTGGVPETAELVRVITVR